MTDRSTGTRTPCSERQPSSSVSRLVRALDDHRVDDHARPVVVGLEDEQAAEHADLSRGQAYALRLLHERRHPVDEPAEVVVELHDLVGDESERRIAVLPDLPEREAAARVGLGFGALVLDGLAVVVVVVLMVVLMIVVMPAHGDAV